MKFDFLKNKALIRALIVAALAGFGLGGYTPLAPVATEAVCQAVGGCTE